MQTESLELSFLSIFALICFFIFFIIQKASSIIGDGVLFIGYDDGYVEAYNPNNGNRLLNKKSHFGRVKKLIVFEQDYYVFSIGDDDSFCSYLVFVHFYQNILVIYFQTFY